MGCGVVSGAPCFWGCWLIYRCWGINALRISISSVQSLLSRLIKSIHSLCLPVLNKVTGFTAHFTQRPIAQVSDQRTTFSSVTFASHSLQLLLIFLLCQYQHTGPAVDFSYLKLTVFIDSDDLLQTVVLYCLLRLLLKMRKETWSIQHQRNLELSAASPDVDKVSSSLISDGVMYELFYPSGQSMRVLVQNIWLLFW